MCILFIAKEVHMQYLGQKLELNLNWKGRKSSNPPSCYDRRATVNIYYIYNLPARSPEYIYTSTLSPHLAGSKLHIERSSQIAEIKDKERCNKEDVL